MCIRVVVAMSYIEVRNTFFWEVVDNELAISYTSMSSGNYISLGDN